MIEIGAVCGALIALITLITLLWQKVIRPIAKAVKKIHALFELIVDNDTRLDRIEDATKQLTPNGGSHMRDAVYRTEEKLDAHLEWSRARHELIDEESKQTQKEILEIYKALTAKDVVQKAVEVVADLPDERSPH